MVMSFIKSMINMIDLTTIKKITNNNPKTIRQFLKVFADNASKDLRELTLVIEREDVQQVSYFVHKLKSSTQSIGFITGHKELQKIEDKLDLNHPIKPLVGVELLNVIRQCELAVVEARRLLKSFKD
jgi:HPt (histidine-containing phosphotransfer) domain-containing protein